MALCECVTTEKTITFDNWRTTATIRKQSFTNGVTGEKATISEITKDGKREKVILVLRDETGTYVYNGTPKNV